jgi:hypothetical protein
VVESRASLERGRKPRARDVAIRRVAAVTDVITRYTR